MTQLYFDNNATTAVAPEVVSAMLPWFSERFGNPSSAHTLGEEAADALRAARASVARLVGARAPSEIVFTSGGTESIHRAIRAALALHPGRRTIVASATEHSAVLEPLAALESPENGGFSIVRVRVDRAGRIDRAELDRALTPDVALVSLMAANNETGVLTDLDGVARACQAHASVFHVDAVQAVGKVPFDAAALGADLASFSAHKIHGPKGVGALFVRGGFEYRNAFGGGPQEAQRRPGTENVPAIVGFGRAAELARAFVLDRTGCAELAARRDRLEREFALRLEAVRVHGAEAPRLPNTTNVAFDGVDAELLLALLSSAGLFVSAGSACHARARQPSHVLIAMGASPAEASSSLRFSLARTTTDAEVDAALALVVESVLALRGFSGA
jgi:cysteine desulfurase